MTTTHSFDRPDRPTAIKQPFMRELANGSKSTLPDGTYYFVCGFGKTNNGDVWDWDKTSIYDGTPIPYEGCSMWVTEPSLGEKGGYLNWLYTGDNIDPMWDLGRAVDPALQDRLKLTKLYGPKAYGAKQPDTKYHLPVIQIQKVKKDYILDDAKPMSLLIKLGMLNKLLAAASATAIADLPDAQPYGKILEVNKLTVKGTPGNDMYKFTFVAKDVLNDIPDFDASIAAIIESSRDSVQRVFQTSNLGSYDPDNVRKYIIQQTQMSYDEFVAKYNVIPELNLVESITFN